MRDEYRECDDCVGDDQGMGLCGGVLLWISWSLFLVTLPFSLLVCFKVCTLQFTVQCLSSSLLNSKFNNSVRMKAVMCCLTGNMVTAGIHIVAVTQPIFV